MFGIAKLWGNSEKELTTISLADMAAHTPVDRRKVSGNRVVSKFAFALPSADQFNVSSAMEDGYCVINARGACFYFKCPISESRLMRIFPQKAVVKIKKLRLLSTENDTKIELSNLLVTFHTFRPTDKAAGLVLKFVNLNNKQLDALEKLDDNFLSITDKNEWEQVSSLQSDYWT